MQRLRIFLVVLLLMFTINFFGQNIPQNISPGVTIQEILTHSKIKFNKVNPQSKLFFSKKTFPVYKENRSFSFKTDYFKSLIIVNEGIVCRAEYKFQKATNVPLRLRLGSVEYTNYLEQKPNALKPN